MSQPTSRAMRERDFQLMQRDTATPLESGRVTALADRCEVEGLNNCATTLRGLLAEVAELREALLYLRAFPSATKAQELADKLLGRNAD
jgi:hypothetical protein